MRARVLIPILLLLLVFCVALGYSVYTNVSSATYRLLNMQIDDTLRIIEGELLEIRHERGVITNEEYQDIVEDFGVVDGGVFVVDQEGTVIADSKRVILGMSVAQHDWFNEVKEKLNSEFHGDYGQTWIYAHSVLLDGKLIVSYVSSQAVEELMVTPLYVIGVVGLILVVVMGILIYLLLTRLLINPIEALAWQVRRIEKGKPIVIKPLKGCPEIAKTGETLNVIMERQKEKLDDLETSLTKAHASDVVVEEVLSELVNTYGGKVKEQELKFSLLVDHNIPQVIVANREDMVSQLNECFDKVLKEASSGSKIEAEARLELGEDTKDAKNIVIVFNVHYNEKDEKIFIKARRGDLL